MASRGEGRSSTILVQRSAMVHGGRTIGARMNGRFFRTDGQGISGIWGDVRYTWGVFICDTVL